MMQSGLTRDDIDEPWKLHLPPGAKAPSGDRYNVFRSYTNGIQCNGIYILPVYNHPYDAFAYDVFQAALPDHQIIPINCNQIIQYLGALHCTSSDVPPDCLPRPRNLTVDAVGQDVLLTWSSVVGAVSYEVFRRSRPYGYDEHLDDAFASTAGSSWTDIGGLDTTSPVVYQVLAIGPNDTRSVLTYRCGGQRYVTSISP